MEVLFGIVVFRPRDNDDATDDWLRREPFAFGQPRLDFPRLQDAEPSPEVAGRVHPVPRAKAISNMAGSKFERKCLQDRVPGPQSG